ncbi:MAG TPA: carbohydrate ABC transporter permease, partial [Candidatus Limnocylindria bacterium]|nr:carbohydrate ABC transporter permease [Candidatus Limnocylindria bacterium]
MTKRKRWVTVGLGLLFAAIAFITLFPLYAILLASLKPTRELFRVGLNVKWDLPIMSLNNYVYLFTGKEGYFQWFSNSLQITAVQTVLTLFVSCFVGYGFAMYDFKGKGLIFACVLIVMMIPLEIILLPLFRLLLGLNLIDKYTGVVLPFIAQALPIFFFRQYIGGLPRDFLDAGRVDGCSEYGIFFRIMLPLTTPSFAAMGILVGMNSWNSFL